MKNQKLVALTLRLDRQYHGESHFGAERLQHVQTDLDYEQKAVFGEISYEFSEQWLLTLGGRHFQYDRVDTTTF